MTDRQAFNKLWFEPRAKKPCTEPFYDASVSTDNQWWIDNSAAIMDRYFAAMMENPKQDPNDVIEDLIDINRKRDPDWFFMYVQKQHYDIEKQLRRKKKVPKVVPIQAMGVQDPRNIWWITLTSDPEKSEEQNKKDIDKFRNSKFKNFKYVWVEEHGTQSERYHQHIMVQGPQKKFHTQQGLKRNEGHYYTAKVIDVQRQPYTEAGINNRIKIYMSKENKPQGDVEYFLDLAKTLGN